MNRQRLPTYRQRHFESLERRWMLAVVPEFISTFGSETIQAVYYSAAQQQAYVSTGQALWGSPLDTRAVERLATFEQSRFEFAELQDRVFFSAGKGGEDPWLWSSDGTPQGTTPIGEIPLNAGPPTELQAAGDYVYVAAGRSLWRTDGSTTGTEPVSTRSSTFPLALTTTDSGRLFFWVRTNTAARQPWLWQSDSSQPVATPVELPTGYRGSELTAVGDDVFFAVEVGDTEILFASDGTSTGTREISRFVNRRVAVQTVLDHEWYFILGGRFTTTGDELWRSDGTSAGTTQVTTITDGDPLTYDGIAQMQAAGDSLFLTDLNNHLWISHGGSAPATLLVSFPNPGSTTISNLVDVDGQLYFLVTDVRQSRSALWRSDGTVAGTEMLWQFDAEIRSLTQADGTLLLASDYELWRYDVGHHVAGTIWHDRNQDGVRASFEDLLPGIVVQAVDVAGSVLAAATTDITGYYSIVLPPAVSFQLQVEIPNGGRWTVPGSDNRFDPASGRSELISLADGNRAGMDGGLVLPSIPNTIEGHLWVDRRANGQPDRGEVPQAGMTVELLAPLSQQVLGQTTTDAAGHYAFSNLGQGIYVVRVAETMEYALSQTGEGVTGNAIHRLSKISPRISLGPSAPQRVNAAIFPRYMIPIARFDDRGTDRASQLLADHLRITEILVDPAEGFIELKNVSDTTLNLRGVRFINGIAFDFTPSPVQHLYPGEHTLIVFDRDTFTSRQNTSHMVIAGESIGTLRNGGERLELVAPINVEILQFAFQTLNWYPLVDRGFSLTILDERAAAAAWGQRSGWRLSREAGGSPGEDDVPVALPDQIVFSEIMSNPSDGVTDWIELHNPSAESIDISGWWLGDDAGNTPEFQLFQIPAGTIVPAGGYVSFERGRDFTFGISRNGESLFLSAGDGQRLLGYGQSVEVSAAPTDQTFGRYVNAHGHAEMVLLQQPTRGTANSPARIGPVYITEAMFYPAYLQQPFVELQNTSGESQYVQFWGNGNDGGLQLGPGQIGVVVPGNADEYRALHNVPDDVLVHEERRLFTYDRPSLKIMYWTDDELWIRSDRLDLQDAAIWPSQLTQGGAALERRAPQFGEGSDPANWQLSDRLGGTPGQMTYQVPGDANGDGRFDSSDFVHVFQAGKYEDAVPHNATFAEGDWNGDGDFTTADLVAAFQAGTYVHSARKQARAN